MASVRSYGAKNGLVNTVRKVIYSILRKLGRITGLFRSLRFWFFTRCWVSQMGKHVILHGLSNHVVIDDDANIYGHTIFEIHSGGHLSIGKHFTLSYGALISCTGEIVIGNDVMIGEYSSLRDSTHSYQGRSIPYSRQSDKIDPILIGNNVWIGRGCVVLPGSSIGDNVIVAANSVVKGMLDPGCIYGGSPAKLLRKIGLEKTEINITNKI